MSTPNPNTTDDTDDGDDSASPDHVRVGYEGSVTAFFQRVKTWRCNLRVFQMLRLSILFAMVLLITSATFLQQETSPITDESALGFIIQGSGEAVLGSNETSSGGNQDGGEGSDGGDGVVRYAYAFVIGGCHPEGKPYYKNYVYSVLVAAKLLRDGGSKADVVAFFQLSYKSNHTMLPADDERALQRMNVRVRYVPKSERENFYRTGVDKFRILGLTEYRRVIYLDADIMPLGSLDYLFEMSDGVDPVLKENVVMQGGTEPANTGLFMIAPSLEDLRLANTIVQQREIYARQAPYPYFDQVRGWGHTIKPPDRWEASNLAKGGENWTFQEAFATAGLLYHWVKYVKKSVSIIQRGGQVQNWGPPLTGMVTDEIVVQEGEPMGREIYQGRLPPLQCYKECGKPPRSDYFHFTGSSKPWLRGPPPDFSNETRLASTKHLWYHTLSVLNKDLELGLDFSNWATRRSQRPLLGMFPVYSNVKTAYSNLLEPSVAATTTTTTTTSEQ